MGDLGEIGDEEGGATYNKLTRLVVKLYKMKERQKNDAPEDQDEVATRPDSSFANSSQTDITPSHSHNTTLVVGEDRGGEGEERGGEVKRGTNMRSPHKQLANELLKKNAETKEMLRAKTSSLLQELSITKQLVCNPFSLSLPSFLLFLLV